MDVTLAVEDGNAKLVNIVEVAGFGIEESVDVDDGLVKLIAWQLLDNNTYLQFGNQIELFSHNSDLVCSICLGI